MAKQPAAANEVAKTSCSDGSTNIRIPTCHPIQPNPLAQCRQGKTDRWPKNTASRRPPPRNTGPCNASPCNTGPCNTGPCNTGPCNTGPCNTGPCNTGPCNNRPLTNSTAIGSVNPLNRLVAVPEPTVTTNEPNPNAAPNPNNTVDV
ncbi:hypothetical protein [Planctomycetes bacterium TBK1r]|uniref:hypothetical protein n=1 Tax=Stieleria magnilauensis TaxID=2527963 RepID=UPI0011A92959